MDARDRDGLLHRAAAARAHGAPRRPDSRRGPRPVPGRADRRHRPLALARLRQRVGRDPQEGAALLARALRARDADRAVARAPARARPSAGRRRLDGRADGDGLGAGRPPGRVALLGPDRDGRARAVRHAAHRDRLRADRGRGLGGPRPGDGLAALAAARRRRRRLLRPLPLAPAGAAGAARPGRASRAAAAAGAGRAHRLARGGGGELAPGRATGDRAGGGRAGAASTRARSGRLHRRPDHDRRPPREAGAGWGEELSSFVTRGRAPPPTRAKPSAATSATAAGTSSSRPAASSWRAAGPPGRWWRRAGPRRPGRRPSA